MTTIAFLSFKEFINELLEQHPASPVRVQAYQKKQMYQNNMLCDITFYLDAAFEQTDIFLCHVEIAQATVFGNHQREQDKLAAAYRRNDESLAAVSNHIRNLGYEVRRGLFAAAADCQAVATLETLFEFEEVEHDEPTPA